MCTTVDAVSGVDPVRTDPVRWPWPAPVRALVGAAVGWLVADGLLRDQGPDWRVWLAMGTLALAGLAATAADSWAGRGVVPGIAVVTVAGIYLGPPETGQVRALLLGLLVLWVAELTGRARVDGFVLLLIDAVLLWAVLWGAVSRPGALIGGAAMLGLLLVLPLVRLVPGPAQGLPDPWRGMALILLQLLFVVGVARTAALSESVAFAAAVSGAALVGLTLLARLVVGRSAP